MKPQFISSYRGEADYSFNGKRYRVRSMANDDGHYNGNYFAEGIAPFVGCVSNAQGDYHAFPPQELLEHFPGYVAARNLPGFTGVEYLGDKPRVCVSRWGWLYAEVYVQDLCQHYGYDPADYGLAETAAAS